MVRSGCVSKRCRAASPTIIFPSRSTLTTEGHNAEPLGPGIHFGAPVCASMYAIRLNVVPKSIPTTRPIVSSTHLRAAGRDPLPPATLPPILFVRQPPNFVCSCADSKPHSFARAARFASHHQRPNPPPHPIRRQSLPVLRPLPRASPENSAPPHLAARANQQHQRHRLAPRAIHQATRSIQKLPPAIPAAPAASWSLPCARRDARAN